MAGPQILGGAQNQGAASLQQGIASIQALGQFLEQRRQFESEQERLNRNEKANWLWKVTGELVKGSDGQSIKDVAKSNPQLLSLLFQQGMGIDEGTAMPMITAWANTPYNADELFASAHTMLNRWGSGELEAPVAAKEQTDAQIKAAQVSLGVGTTPGETPPSATPAAVPPVEAVVPKGMEPGQLDPSGVLNELKKELYQVEKEQEKAGFAVGVQGVLPTIRVVDKFKTENPTYADAIEKWKQNDMTAFLRDVEAGRWEPGMAQTGPRPSSAAPGDRIQRERLQQQEAKSAAIELKMKPVVVTAKAPEKSNVEPTMMDYLSSIEDEEGPGQVKVKQTRLEKALTPQLAANMEASPQGQKALVENAMAVLNDPMLARTMALQQNAPAVYGIDLEASGSTKKSKLDITKAMLELEKLGLEVEKARIALAREGIAGADDQNKLILSSAVVSMLQDGTIVPPAVAEQASRLLTEMEDARKSYETAKAKGDKTTTNSALAAYNRLRTQWAGMMTSVSKAMKNTDSPNAQKYAKLLDSTLTLEPTRALGFLWKQGVGKWNLVEKGTTTTTTKAAEIPKDEADFEKALGF
jgi:hypothetical protein